jgi:hypothetical protein
MGLGARFAVYRINTATDPVLWISSEVVDLGVIAANQDARADIVVRNNGGGPLQIQEIHLTCVCIRASLGATALAPGAETKLSITIHGERPADSLEQTVTIRANDPRQAEQWVRVRYSVCASRFQFEPALIDFGRVARPDLPLERHVLARLPIEQARASRNSDDFQTQVDDPGFLAARIVSDGGIPKVFIQLGPEAPSGELCSLIHCLEPLSKETHELQVSAYVRGEFYAHPTSVVLSKEQLRPVGGPAETLQIRRRSATPSGPIAIHDIRVSTNIASWISARPAAHDGEAVIELHRCPETQSTSQEFARRTIGFIRAKVSSGSSAEVVNVPVEVMTGRELVPTKEH